MRLNGSTGTRLAGGAIGLAILIIAAEVFVLACTPTGASAQTPTPSVMCPPAPAAGCREPGKSSLKFLDRFANGPGVKDKLVWRFLGGPPQPRSDFGDPTSTTDHGICIYADAVLLMQSAVNETTSCSPMGLCCGPCWRAKGDDTYQYVYRAGGIRKITLKASSGPRTKILLQSRSFGLGYTAATLPFGASTIAVRLHNSDNGNCWGADFPASSFKRNDEEHFAAQIP